MSRYLVRLSATSGGIIMKCFDQKYFLKVRCRNTGLTIIRLYASEGNVKIIYLVELISVTVINNSEREEIISDKFLPK